MKPSERRALREAKAQKENESIEGIAPDTDVISAQAANADKPRKKKSKREKSILDDDVESMRHEGFFQSHVKLITFIICMVVILSTAILVPLIHWLNTRTVLRGETPMELEHIVAIAEKKQFISWDDFDGFIYTDQSTREIRQHFYVIKGTTYAVMVTGPKADKVYPDNVTFYDTSSGTAFIDLTIDDIHEFLAGTAKTPTKYISTEEVLAVANKTVYVKWTDFAEYKFTERTEATEDKQGMIIIREYALDDADFSVWVYGDKVIGRPQRVLLVDNMNHSNFVDLTNTKEAEAFINKNILKK